MTDEDIISTTERAAALQLSVDQLTRLRDEAKATMNGYDTRIKSAQTQLDDLWKHFRTQVGSGA